MPFTSALHVTQADDGDRWRLTRRLVYQGKRERFVVPAGEVTDFASVPRWLWPVLPPTGPGWTRAAVLHDHHYRTGGVSRADADGLFRRIMREGGTGRVRRRLMWAGVRMGGWLAWRKYRRGSI